MNARISEMSKAVERLRLAIVSTEDDLLEARDRERRLATLATEGDSPDSALDAKYGVTSGSTPGALPGAFERTV